MRLKKIPLIIFYGSVVLLLLNSCKKLSFTGFHSDKISSISEVANIGINTGIKFFERIYLVEGPGPGHFLSLLSRLNWFKYSSILPRPAYEHADSTKILNPAVEFRAYFVAPEGRNFYPGTESHPFQTIQYAANLVKPGDTVIVKDGIYSTTGYNLFNITRSGTEEACITFKSQHKHGAKLTGLNNKGEFAIFLSKGASWINILNFEIEGFKSCGIDANDSELQSNQITIKGNKIHDIGRYETISSYGLCAIYLRKGQHHWMIHGNLIYNIGRTGPDSYWYNKDHAIYSGYSDDRSACAHHISVTCNVIWGCSGHALNMGSDNDLIANNVFVWSNENHHYGKEHPHSGPCFITYDEGTKNITIANNIFYQPPEENKYAISGCTTCIGWKVMNNLVKEGEMWESSTPGRIVCVAGNNYCSSGCEKRVFDPLFVFAKRENAPEVNFSLKPGSPCINAGLNVGLTEDYLGKPIKDTPDIGAYEYQH